MNLKNLNTINCFRLLTQQNKFRDSKYIPLSQKFAVGRISSLASKDQKFLNQSFDKGKIKTFVLWFLKKYGEKKTLKLLEELKFVGFGYATKAGTSIGIEDLLIPDTKSVLIGESEKLIYYTRGQSKRGDITEVEKFQRMIDSWHQTSETLKNDVVKSFEKKDVLNPVYMMAFSGARGNLSQVRQLVGMRGLMSDPQGRIIDFPIRSNFKEGLTLTEYVISTYGARKGIVDTALRTANAGYLTRRLVDVAQHVIVSNFDCGTKRGIVVNEMKEGLKTIYSLPNRLLGRVLATNVTLENGEVIEKDQEIFADLALKISKSNSKVFIRSPLTCETRRLVCQLCYGWTLGQGALVSIGEAVGIIAAQSIGEPGTQLTMRTFHTGGVFSGDLTEEVLAFENGIITYSSSIPGTLIRTPGGKIAFLTKNSGELKFIGKTTEKNYKLPPFSILYARNGQSVLKKDLIAQISTKIGQKQQREDVEQKILSELEGVFYNGHVDLVEKMDDYSDPIFESKDWGYVWILSGKIYRLPLDINILPQSGDLITPKSIISQISWKESTKGKIDFDESNFLPQISKNLFYQEHKKKQTLIISSSIFSTLLKNIKYKSFGYTLFTDLKKQNLESLSSSSFKNKLNISSNLLLKNWNSKPKCENTEKFFIETGLKNNSSFLRQQNEKEKSLSPFGKIQKTKTNSISGNSLIRDNQTSFPNLNNTDEWRQNPNFFIQWFPKKLHWYESGLIKFIPQIISKKEIASFQKKSLSKNLLIYNKFILLRKQLEARNPKLNSLLETEKIDELSLNTLPQITHPITLLTNRNRAEAQIADTIYSIPRDRASAQKEMNVHKINNEALIEQPTLLNKSSEKNDLKGSFYLIQQKFVKVQKLSVTSLLSKPQIKKQNHFKSLVLNKLLYIFLNKAKNSPFSANQFINLNIQGNNSITTVIGDQRNKTLEIRGIAHVNAEVQTDRFFPHEKKKDYPTFLSLKYNEKLRRIKTTRFLKEEDQIRTFNKNVFIYKNLLIKSLEKEKTFPFSNCSRNKINSKSNLSVTKLEKVLTWNLNSGTDSNWTDQKNKNISNASKRLNVNKANENSLINFNVHKIFMSLTINKKKINSKLIVRYKPKKFETLINEKISLLFKWGWIYCSFQPQHIWDFYSKNISNGKKSIDDLIFDGNEINISSLHITETRLENCSKEQTPEIYNPCFGINSFEKQFILPIKMNSFDHLSDCSKESESKKDFTSGRTNFGPIANAMENVSKIHWIKNNKSIYFLPSFAEKSQKSLFLIQKLHQKPLEDPFVYQRQLIRLQVNSDNNEINPSKFSLRELREKYHSNIFNKQQAMLRILSKNPPSSILLEQIYQFPVKVDTPYFDQENPTFLKTKLVKKSKNIDKSDFSLLRKQLEKDLNSFALPPRILQHEEQSLFLKQSEHNKTSFYFVKRPMNVSYFLIGFENYKSSPIQSNLLKIDLNLKRHVSNHSRDRINSLNSNCLRNRINSNCLRNRINSSIKWKSPFDFNHHKLDKMNSFYHASNWSSFKNVNTFATTKKTTQKNSIFSMIYFHKKLKRHKSNFFNLPILTISNIEKKAFFMKTYKKEIPLQNSFSLNEIQPTEKFANTGFLSAYTGEILNIPQYYWSNKTNKNSLLILTNSDLTGFHIPQVANAIENIQKKSELIASKSNSFHQSNNLQVDSGKSIERQTFFTENETLIKVDEKIFKIKGIKIGPIEERSKIQIGEFLVYGDKLSKDLGISNSGQVVHMNRFQLTLRKGQPIFLSPRAILNNYTGDFVESNKYIITLPYQRLKTGDIVQGIPKVEQFFEARTTKAGKFFRDSIPNLLKGLFKHYRKKLPLQKAVRQSFYKIQQILVDGVQRVYRSQGVSIADKHIEVIVKQMTSKVRILNGGQTGFFPGEILDLDFVEEINLFLLRKIRYEPIILGITRASLEVESFLAAASFQQTTKMLSRAALYRKKDFLKGLKENVILGNLIPAGTGYLVYIENSND